MDEELQEKIKGLIQELGSDNWESAGNELVNIGEPAVPALIEVLKKGRFAVRYYSVIALSKIGVNDEQFETIVHMLKHGDIRVRREAAEVIGKIGGVSAAPALIYALKEEYEDVRKKAAEALGEIGDRSAIPALIDALDDENLKVREEAVKTLVKMRKAAVPALIEALKDEDEDVRKRAAGALGEIGVEVDLVKVGQRLKEFVDRVKKGGDKFEVKNAKKEAIVHYKKIANAVKEAKASERMGGVLLEGSFRPKDRKDKMFRVVRAFT